MKKEYILGILFFGGLWGISEAVIGDLLYSAHVNYASVPLTIIGFIIMTTAWVHFPRTGTATLIAAFAMLYKFLNVPFFRCHLLGILMTGFCFDLFFNIIKIKRPSISAAAAVYLSYALFGLMITYIFRYQHWVAKGFAGVLRHIAISGSMAALGSAVLVPNCIKLFEQFKINLIQAFNVRMQFIPGSVLAVTIGLWVFGITAYIF
ncbi:MAG: hypothetical protein JW837_03350 [Sedimentisphaerales bacterium]|nr:hypothetical protein [Sedimentisphaerales bacterium]